jgi:predicted Rossmann fold flavoprotein
MMASIKASSNKNSVLLIENNDKIGKKLLLTGGGRCNLTNLKSIDNFIREIPVNSKMLYSILNQFGPQDIYDYFIELGVKLKVEDDDRVFPLDNKSKTIIEALENQLHINKVNIHLNETVQKMTTNNDYKEVITDKDKYLAKNVIISTGGCTYSHTGSTGDGYKLAKMINQDITNLYPADTFLLSKEILPLAGITLDDVIIHFDNKKVKGSLLFTHNGIIVPSVFKISEEVYKALENNKYVTINIDLIPDYNIDELLIKLDKYNPKKEINSFVREYTPKRLGDYIINNTCSNMKIGEGSKTKKMLLLNSLKNFKIDIKGTGAMDQSLVTGGGVDMKFINPKTMESTKNKGIYFVGELLDIHGHTGGYNITLALSTGYAAGSSIRRGNHE